MCNSTVRDNNNSTMRDDDTQHALEEAKGFILQTLKSAGNRKYWDILSPRLKADRDIALTAFIHDQVKIKGLPECFRNDRHFFLGAVRKMSKCWFRLPASMKSDPAFPRSFYKFNGDELVTAVFEKMPFLCQEIAIWSTIISSIQSSSVGCSLESITSWAPPEILSNTELMLKACISDVEALSLVDLTLAQDKEFLEKVLNEKPEALSYISTDAHSRFPSLLRTHLQAFFNTLGAYMLKERLLQRIPQEFYSKNWFIKTWLTTGGPFESDFFPDHLRNDPKIFLMFAKHHPGHGSIVQKTFACASELLLSDVAFMFKVVAFKPEIFWSATEDLQNDYEFTVAALAGPGCFAEEWVRAFLRGNDSNAEFDSFTTEMKDDLELHRVFVSTFLFGTTQKSSSLTMLNQGPETTTAIKKHIAGYAGVPTGTSLGTIRRATENILLAHEKIRMDEEARRSRNNGSSGGFRIINWRPFRDSQYDDADESNAGFDSDSVYS